MQNDISIDKRLTGYPTISHPAHCPLSWALCNAGDLGRSSGPSGETDEFCLANDNKGREKWPARDQHGFRSDSAASSARGAAPGTSGGGVQPDTPKWVSVEY